MYERREKVHRRKQIKRFISSILDSVFVLIYFATRPPEGFILSFEAFEGVGRIPYPEKVKKKGPFFYFIYVWSE